MSQRCKHAFIAGLCVFESCEHWDGARPVRRAESTHMAAIVQLAARAHGYTAEDLQAKGRTADLVDARHVAMLLARRAGFSLSEIGRYLRRDHSTVCHGVRRAESQLGNVVTDIEADLVRRRGAA